ncbi:MAG: Lrp/AsnC family transcriptional regulator [Oceanospirillaceae bacterium]
MQKIISTESTKFKLSDKDRQLLTLLQENARESNASLARKIGVSRATVQERLHKLESAGIIAGYGVRINPQNLHRNIDAIVMMVAENKSFQETFIEMEKMPYIQTIHSLSGEWDWSIFISAPTIEDFHQCITQMNALAGVKSTVSHIIMKTRLDRKNDINNF